MVSIPYVRGVSEQFKRVAMRRGFRTAFRPRRKVKEIKTRSQQPLGDKRKAVVYKIPCKCNKAVYVGETWRLFKTRKNEHRSKVWLTNEDLRFNAAEERMGLVSNLILLPAKVGSLFEKKKSQEAQESCLPCACLIHRTRPAHINRPSLGSCKSRFET